MALGRGANIPLVHTLSLSLSPLSLSLFLSLSPLSLSLSPPLSLPLFLPPPALSFSFSIHTGTEEALGDMPDGEAVEGLELPVITAVEQQSVTVPQEVSGGGQEVISQEGHSGRGGDGGVNLPKTAEEAPKPFILSEGLPPIPAKLVGRIVRGEFIDMSELLRDNLEAQRRGAMRDPASAASSVGGTGRLRREVPDLLSWVQCFGMYTAVVGSKFPERVPKLLAYQTLIIREARRCGGRGWLSYDTYFRQQMVGEWKGEEWGRLNPYLFSSTFLALGGPQRVHCSLCMESDHREEECALARESAPKGPPAREQMPRWEPPRQARGKTLRQTACFTWNQGECTFPYCKFRHVCVRCAGEHKIINCRAPHNTPMERRTGREREMKGSQ